MESQEWHVRVGQQTFIASSLEELSAWYAEGRVRPEHYVFHPVLQRWMYAGELRELSAALSIAARPPAFSSGSPQDQTVRVKSLTPWVVGVLIVIVVFSWVLRSASSPDQSPAKKASRLTAARAIARPGEVAAELRALESESLSSTEAAKLCEKLIGSLSSENRKRCAEIHLSLAKAAIEAGDGDRAQDLLAFSEMEGGPLSEIRGLRERAAGSASASASAGLPSQAKSDIASKSVKVTWALKSVGDPTDRGSMKLRVEGKTKCWSMLRIDGIDWTVDGTDRGRVADMLNGRPISDIRVRVSALRHETAVPTLIVYTHRGNQQFSMPLGPGERNRKVEVDAPMPKFWDHAKFLCD